MIYVLRSSVNLISPALYRSTDAGIVLDATNSKSAGAVLSSGDVSNVQIGQELNYEQVLELVLKDSKVITL